MPLALSGCRRKTVWYGSLFAFRLLQWTLSLPLPWSPSKGNGRVRQSFALVGYAVDIYLTTISFNGLVGSVHYLRLAMKKNKGSCEPKSVWHIECQDKIRESTARTHSRSQKNISLPTYLCVQKYRGFPRVMMMIIISAKCISLQKFYNHQMQRKTWIYQMGRNNEIIVWPWRSQHSIKQMLTWLYVTSSSFILRYNERKIWITCNFPRVKSDRTILTSEKTVSLIWIHSDSQTKSNKTCKETEIITVANNNGSWRIVFALLWTNWKTDSAYIYSLFHLH